ncbi:hypothetical protein POSPLADRAFT_1045613 [Postia placenta MAD-698-R-SB12]|uniref:Uncharacterized protein n=1 Tax=Postia placenta MAD-698-R-SB12 TaxID=670580 RepID=A0A1X6N3P6_9APHY|nr:hypothetical protein POSPLADRAFT_1045613 [Postia placenta MAD-698-R-SB12]OSX63215.1 hypothetical protein POSPLADRAFT_1045613 [Postia placenta MAD-698-R-SB12]
MLASALLFTGLIAILLCSLAEAENTTCAGNALNWYSDAVGETPCREYQVPTFSNTAPGDKCNDELMVHTTSIVTTAVLAQINLCNEGIKLDNFLYNLFWNTGACIIVNFYRIYSNIIVHFVIAYTRSVNNREPRRVFKQRFIHCYEQQSQHINGSRRCGWWYPGFYSNHSLRVVSLSQKTDRGFEDRRPRAVVRATNRAVNYTRADRISRYTITFLQADSNDNPLDVDTAELVPYVTVTQSALQIGDGPTLTHLPSTRSRVTCPPSRGAPPTYYSSEPSGRAPPTYHSHES